MNNKTPEEILKRHIELTLADDNELSATGEPDCPPCICAGCETYRAAVKYFENGAKGK